jgi:hypothetical protein
MSRRIRSLVLVLGALVPCLVLTLWASSSVSASTPTTAPIMSPPEGCLRAVTDREVFSWSTASTAAASSVVVVADVTTVGRGRWSTADGQRPAVSSHRAPAAVITTPLAVQVVSSHKGTSAGSVDVILPGGSSGCDTYQVTDLPFNPAPGRYAIFLVPTAGQSATGANLTVLAMWPVSNGVVKTPADGEVPLGDWQAIVKQSSSNK